MPGFELRNSAVVAHAGSRDHYQLALALAEAGYLADLVTDFYVPDAIVQKIRKLGFDTIADNVATRSCTGLDRFSVRPIALAASILAGRARDPARLWAYGDRRMSLGALKRARRNPTPAILYLYSYYAYEAFKAAGADGTPRILFQLHPHPRECRRIFEEDIAANPAGAPSLRLEKEMMIGEAEMRRLSEESALADHIVVASGFTRDSLVRQGIGAGKITVIPYGVDGGAFPARTAPPSREGPLRIAFLGSFVQRKGASYLLEAVNAFPPSQVRLAVATRAVRRDSLPPGAQSDNIEYHVGLDRAHLPAFLHRCDAFALPSLAEGFGLAITEAMAVGLPVIATPNSCAADVVEQGKTGLIVPIRDAEALKQAIQTCLDRRAELFEMGQKAARKARDMTWQRFRANIVDDYRHFAEGLSG